MAIFDSEKRPRGLRVPSLTAMKAGTAASVSQFSFHRSKSNESRTPEEESVPVIPSTGSYYPPPPAPPPTKDLPIPPSGPKKELPPRPSLSTKVPPRKSVGSNNTTTPRPTETYPSEAHGLRSAFSAISPAISTSPPKQEQPLPPTPSLGLRQAGSTTTPVSPPLEQDPESPATIKAPQGLRQTETPVSPQLSKPQPVPVQQQQQQQSLPPTPPVAPQNTPPEIEAKAPIPAPIPARVSIPVPAPAQQLQNQQLPPTPPPVTLSTPPTEEDSEALTPLEDFIPTPEGATTPLDLDEMSSNEASGPPGLADIEPVAAPLNKVHFACFQEHRNMPIAQNVWCPVPCMTCHKHDQEIRHRCVFCSLRICEGCYRSLQKMKNRSLTTLMDSLGSTSAQ